MMYKYPNNHKDMVLKIAKNFPHTRQISSLKYVFMVFFESNQMLKNIYTRLYFAFHEFKNDLWNDLQINLQTILLSGARV